MTRAHRHWNSRHSIAEQGFTLWECCISLLVMSVAFAGMRWQWMVPRDASLKKEVETLQSFLQETRLQAAMKRTHARLLIHADPDRDPEKAYRECVIQVLDEETKELWLTIGSVYVLHPQHRMVPLRSDVETAVPDTSLGMQKVESEGMEDRWGEWVRCYSLEFKATGRISSTSYVLVIEQLAASHEKSIYRALRVNSYGQSTQLVSSQDHERTK